MLNFGHGNKENGMPEVSDLRTVYSQVGDFMGSGVNGHQEMVLESCYNGDKPFIRIRIPQEANLDGYWTITSIEDFKNILNDFSEKLNYNF